MPCRTSACMKARVRGPAPAAAAAAAAAGPFMRILWASLGGPGMQILWRSYSDMLSEAFGWSVQVCVSLLTKSSMVFSHRSLWEDLVKILLASSSRSPCSKISKMLYIGACVWFLLGCFSEDLVERSCKILYIYVISIESPAATVEIMSDLISFCSMATVACICYLDFLPTALFGASCRLIL